MSGHVKWTKGGQARVTAVTNDTISLVSTVPSPPGSRIDGEVLGGAMLRVKIHASKKQKDGSFILDGRPLDLSRELRERLLAPEIVPIDPQALRPHYAAFLREGRVLLTGHSHQAWPDVARAALTQSFDDAAEHVDDKWDKAFAAADAVRRAVAERISAEPEEIALAPNTHELVVRFLSALDVRKKRHIVTTTGEFHSIDRQLHRLAEEGVDVTFVEALPADSLADRLASAIREDTACVLASYVLFQTSSVVPHLRGLAQVARASGAALLVDAYHAFNVVPFAVEDVGPDVFVVGGGYKYAQWGEGVCFLRAPKDTPWRPVYTGWFAGFGGLAAARGDGKIPYGNDPSVRFAGATYDPASHYRARAVVDFFREQDLTVSRLRALSLLQTTRVMQRLEGLPIATPASPNARGGFIAVRVTDSASVVNKLRDEGIFVDARGELVRLGPAPYVTNDEIDRACDAIVRVVRG